MDEGKPVKGTPRSVSWRLGVLRVSRRKRKWHRVHRHNFSSTESSRRRRRRVSGSRDVERSLVPSIGHTCGFSPFCFLGDASDQWHDRTRRNEHLSRPDYNSFLSFILPPVSVLPISPFPDERLTTARSLFQSRQERFVSRGHDLSERDARQEVGSQNTWLTATIKEAPMVSKETLNFILNTYSRAILIFFFFY